ncbi:hypothetical protein [Paenibacillus eucommiae]|uniref:Uncharacterized protein n=1 Tax=Paenibacillus eucommiae TaxID=1355755 RepID=A0ABS4J7W3_9BACL|nr:hypothetical protein [Paenibacillus eucommiae]MBP1995930.1 hypothetical protein [Paenibacillus eucommiae]
MFFIVKVRLRGLPRPGLLAMKNIVKVEVLHPKHGYLKEVFSSKRGIYAGSSFERSLFGTL